MKLSTLLIIITVLIIGVCLLKHRQIERFFSGLPSLDMSWKAPSANPSLQYVWTACASDPSNKNSGCSITNSPDNWGGTMTTTAVTQASLSDSTCNGCDYDKNILFAVKTLDTQTGLSSGWATASMNFTLQKDIYSVGFSPQPQVGDTSFLYVVQFITGMLQTTDLMVVEITLTRGGSVMTLGPANMNIRANGSSAATYKGSLADTAWVPQAPEILKDKDVISATALIANKAAGGEKYYYGNISVTLKAVAPQPPSGVTWTF